MTSNTMYEGFADGPGAAEALAAAALTKLRRDGHLYADLDPLQRAEIPVAGMTDSEVGTSRAAWFARFLDGSSSMPPTTEAGLNAPGHGAPPAMPQLYSLIRRYCGTLAVEAEHVRDADQRAWLYDRIESGDLAPSETADLQRQRLMMLVAVDAFERYLQQHFVGEKTLSVEGLDTTVLMAEELVQLAAAAQIGQVFIGMAHRGRLSMLTYICGMKHEDVMRHFEASRGTCPAVPQGITDDVAQHLGHDGVRYMNGQEIRVCLLPQPSHLESVNPVALGAARAVVDAGTPALTLLLHGDAGFTGQGIAAEAFNLSGLAAYSSGGTVHIIQDNGLGFTTEPSEGRATRWPSDIARGFDAPILHVNADDVLACLQAVRIAFAFRQRFSRDVVLHVLGYRRLGHTETDEPRFTQARLYRSIEGHPRVVDQFTASLLEDGMITAAELDAERERVRQYLERCRMAARATGGYDQRVQPQAVITSSVRTGVPADQLRGLARRMGTLPTGFKAHPKVSRVLERRIADAEKRGQADWPHAELLAFAASAVEGITVRLSGQDVVRGTFSQRHASVRDIETDKWHSIFVTLDEARRPPLVVNSPLSEASVLGFEYGYASGNPDALPVWEAQFGDFANGAQVIIDQFVSSGYAKWGRTNRLVMLLPHGYEGAGPEHSSARVERYLQLAAEDNLTIVMPTTAAQYFHALRWQALRSHPCPLVVFTPKSLLRAESIASPLGDFEPYLGFRRVIAAASGEEVLRIVFAAGKFAVKLEEAARTRSVPVLVCRMEQLAPWPTDEVSELLARYPDAEVLWAQEEPENMGALHFAERNLRRAVPGQLTRHTARPARAAVAEGFAAMHTATQARLIDDVFAPGAKRLWALD